MWLVFLYACARVCMCVCARAHVWVSDIDGIDFIPHPLSFLDLWWWWCCAVPVMTCSEDFYLSNGAFAIVYTVSSVVSSQFLELICKDSFSLFLRSGSLCLQLFPTWPWKYSLFLSYYWHLPFLSVHFTAFLWLCWDYFCVLSCCFLFPLKLPWCMAHSQNHLSIILTRILFMNFVQSL